MTDFFIVQFKKISILCPQKALVYPWGLGVLKDQKMLRYIGSFTGISRGVGGGRKKIPSVGEVWIFSGTTHLDL